MSFYVCGDTHGDIDIHKLSSRCFDCDGLSRDDYVLVCGDFGVIWSDGPDDEYMKKWYGNKPWTTLFIDGNHENHNALDSYKAEEWMGGKVHRITDSIIHLMRGQVYNIDGYKIFTMGGATSHDKVYRRENISWWKREIPSLEECNTAIDNLNAANNCVDFIFTHCASSITQKKIADWFENDPLTQFFNLIEDVDFKKWYFGHYHIDKNIDDKHIALYDRVLKLW